MASRATQDQGYLVVRRSDELRGRAQHLAQSSGKPDVYNSYLDSLYLRFPELRAMTYAGIDRFAVECGGPDMELLEPEARSAALALLAHIGLTGNQLRELGEPRASRLLARRMGRSRSSYLVDVDFDPDLIPCLELAVEVQSATASPAAWEIVEVLRGHALSTHGQALRFDVATWSGWHVSAIRDVFSAPEYSPSPLESFEELAAFVPELGADMLFRSQDVAREFATWYAHQQVAYGGCGAFVVGVVGVMPVQHGS